MSNDCLICRKQNGQAFLPGEAIYQDELVFACHAFIDVENPQVYLGWLSVETRRHIPGLAELTDEEGQALGKLIARLSRALIACTDAEHIYLFVLGHGVPHLHVHLIARYPGAPREYWGARVDEWPDAPHGGPLEITALCEKLRLWLNG
jgi:diadenosine tetraphosphate (Ap4A) HIT family hydrolase